METLEKILWSVVLLIIGVCAYFLVRRTVLKIMQKVAKNDRLAKKRDSYAKLLKNLLKYVIIIIVVILILQVNGIDVTSIIAGLGIASLIAGLALQDTLKNMIAGFNIVADDYFMVGDVLEVNGREGKVIDLRLKTTKLKDIKTQDIYVISNQEIKEALIVSKQMDIDVPLPYEEDLKKVEKIMAELVREIEKIEKVEKVSYQGLNEFADSAIKYKIRILVKPELKPVVRRAANRIIKETLERENLSIPYQQVEVRKR